MAEARLDSKKDTGLIEAFEQLECKRIGDGKLSDNDELNRSRVAAIGSSALLAFT